METREKLDNYLSENFEFFIERLTTEHKSLILEGDRESKTAAFVVSDDDFENLTGLPPTSIEYYQSNHCGHEYDCCGCLSSQRIRIIKHDNNYITIFLTTRFNY